MTEVLRRTKDSTPPPLFCPFIAAPPRIGDDTDENDEDDNGEPKVEAKSRRKRGETERYEKRRVNFAERKRAGRKERRSRKRRERVEVEQNADGKGRCWKTNELNERGHKSR